MWTHLKDKTKCPSGANCTFAHSAIQLDLIPIHKVVRYLQDTADALDKRLKNDSANVTGFLSGRCQVSLVPLKSRQNSET
jgi:hypothetical protein